jgi:hypothetical protein
MAGDAKRLAGAWPAGGGLRLMLQNKPVKNILFLLRKNDRTFERRFYSTAFSPQIFEDGRRLKMNGPLLGG